MNDLTLRDYFAAKIMAAMVAGNAPGDFSWSNGEWDTEKMMRLAHAAYTLAEAMIAMRKTIEK